MTINNEIMRLAEGDIRYGFFSHEDNGKSQIQNGVQESLNLDYKRCESLDKRNPKSKKELSKDISAFANSAGGVIIYGVIEINHVPTAIDSGYDPTNITREWLEQVINSTIQRRIDGIRIKQIELRKSNPGRVIYLVNIPQSKRAPHMAEDHIFYKRFNYESRAMEEYEVRDVLSRADVPDLSLQFLFESNLVNIEFESVNLEFTAVNLEFEEDKESSKSVILHSIITNEAIAPAMYYIISLFFDKRLTVIHNGGFTFTSEQTLQLIDTEFIMNSYYRNYSVPGVMPVWKGVKFQIAEPPVQIAIPKVNGDMTYGLVWAIDSLGMQRKFGGTILAVSNNQAALLAVPASLVKSLS